MGTCSAVSPRGITPAISLMGTVPTVNPRGAVPAVYCGNCSSKY